MRSLPQVLLATGLTLLQQPWLWRGDAAGWLWLLERPPSRQAVATQNETLARVAAVGVLERGLAAVVVLADAGDALDKMVAAASLAAVANVAYAEDVRVAAASVAAAAVADVLADVGAATMALATAVAVGDARVANAMCLEVSHLESSD